MGCVEEFNKLQWHDSKLVGIHVSRHASHSDDVILDILLRKGYQGNFERTKLQFSECSAILLDIDLIGKAECSDDIAEAFCHEDSSLLDRMRSQLAIHGEESPTGQYHFEITLIQPGGSIHVIAKGFHLSHPSRSETGESET